MVTDKADNTHKCQNIINVGDVGNHSEEFLKYASVVLINPQQVIDKMLSVNDDSDIIN